MSAYLESPEIWQESWDRQQSAFLPDREHRFATMLDAVAATTGGRPPRLLDLAGGTGTIALRTLARFPGAEVTVLDQDPVLLAIAESSLRDRGRIVRADLSDPSWRAAASGADAASKAGAASKRGARSETGAGSKTSAGWKTGTGSDAGTGSGAGEFDAVLTATALHWLPAERVAALYAEIREVLRPGGIFANADHMPEESLPTLSKRLREHARDVRDARYATGSATSWPEWWARAAADEFLGPKAVERERIYPGTAHHQEWTPPAAWHIDALRMAGFAEAGILWRGGTDAAVIGMR
jgi:trans-aconitate methyltransferase